MIPGAIIFDLDDTLYEYIDYRHSGFRAVAKFLQKTEDLTESSLYRRLTYIDSQGGSLYPNTFDKLVNHFGFHQDRVAEMVDIYRKHKPEIQLFPDALQLLQNLKTASVPMFLLTEGTRISQINKILALKINMFFEDIYILTPPATYKGQRHTYDIIVKESATPASRIWVVGDNPQKDFTIPLQLGMCCFHIKQGIRRFRETPGNVVAIRSLKELYNHLTHMRNR